MKWTIQEAYKCVHAFIGTPEGRTQQAASSSFLNLALAWAIEKGLAPEGTERNSGSDTNVMRLLLADGCIVKNLGGFYECTGKPLPEVLSSDLKLSRMVKLVEEFSLGTEAEREAIKKYYKQRRKQPKVSRSVMIEKARQMQPLVLGLPQTAYGHVLCFMHGVDDILLPDDRLLDGIMGREDLNRSNSTLTDGRADRTRILPGKIPGNLLIQCCESLDPLTKKALFDGETIPLRGTGEELAYIDLMFAAREIFRRLWPDIQSADILKRETTSSDKKEPEWLHV